MKYINKILNIVSNGATDKGRVRKVNQDSFLVDNESSLWIVADGMGGHAGGEIASQICIQALSKYFSTHITSTNKNPISLIPHLMTNAINFASSEIYDKAIEDQALKGMGTTATAVTIFDNHLYCGHVGDSRLYLIREQFIYQVTNDHSLVSEQVRAGIITVEEAKKHKLKNIITRSVGYQEQEYVDTFHFPLAENDIIMICSDGLHNKIANHELSCLIFEQKDQAVENLIKLANKRGGEDNITVIILHAQNDDRERIS